MAFRGRIFRIPDGDQWSADVESHPSEPGRWCWVIHLNGERVTSGGCFRTARRATEVAAGSLRVRQAIHYGAVKRADDEMSKE
jgi:hypothetical protein